MTGTAGFLAGVGCPFLMDGYALRLIRTDLAISLCGND